MSSAADAISAVIHGTERWCVVNEDCLVAMRAMVAAGWKVAHVVTDPPYAPRAMKNARTNGETMKQRRDGVVYDFNYSALDESTRRDAAKSFAALARRWILVWCDEESTHLWRWRLKRYGARYIRKGTWVRLNGAPQFSGDRPGQGTEACIIAHAEKGKLRWNGGGHPATWHHQIVNSQADDRVHTTPKPLELMLEQISQFTDEGDVILDPFCGSGTTGVACLRLGRRFIGIEKDATYAKVAADRLEAEGRGLSLRDARAGQGSIWDILQPPPKEKP